MRTISQRELRNDSGEVLRQVEAGASFTVTRRGLPVADLVPHSDTHDSGPTRFVPAERFVSAVGGVGDWDVEAFDQEQQALDLSVDDEQRDDWRTP